MKLQMLQCKFCTYDVNSRLPCCPRSGDFKLFLFTL